MPKTDIDYSHAVIYKLVCKDVDIKDCYVGSTTNFRIRKNSHKSSCNNEKSKQHNMYVYKFIRDNGGMENFQMILVENYPCESKLELESRERSWVELLSAKLNKSIPTRSGREYHKVYDAQHKEEKKAYNKMYSEINKETINKKAAEQQLCVCGGWHSRAHKCQHAKTTRHRNFINRYDIIE